MQHHYPGAPPPPPQQLQPQFAGTNPSPAAPSNNINTDVDVDAKILSDLSVVQEKITLCNSILTNENITFSSQIDAHDSLLTVIGFLEACVPRVRELIDVGMTLLKEETLTVCFQVNDELCKVLEDVEHPEKRSVTPSTAAGAVTTGSDNGIGSGSGVNDALDTLDFDAFGFEDRKRSITDSTMGSVGAGSSASASATAIDQQQPATSSTSKVASSTLEDLLAPPSATPSVSVGSSAAEPKDKSSKVGGDDGDDDDDDDNVDEEFDDFFWCETSEQKQLLN